MTNVSLFFYRLIFFSYSILKGARCCWWNNLALVLAKRNLVARRSCQTSSPLLSESYQWYLYVRWILWRKRVAHSNRQRGPVDGKVSSWRRFECEREMLRRVHEPRGPKRYKRRQHRPRGCCDESTHQLWRLCVLGWISTEFRSVSMPRRLLSSRTGQKSRSQ